MSPNEFRPARSSRPSKLSATRLGSRLVIALVVMAFGYYASQQQANNRPAVAEKPVAEKPISTDDNASTDPTKLASVTLRDQEGNVVYRGSVDLAPTLKRIAANERLSFPNDGSVFQNRERRLPKQKSGYYHEWVHPTPKLSGPGPQRIVTGESGEAYYTPDHYETFLRIK